MSSHSSNHPREVLLVQFSLYPIDFIFVHFHFHPKTCRGGLLCWIVALGTNHICRCVFYKLHAYNLCYKFGYEFENIQ